MKKKEFSDLVQAHKYAKERALYSSDLEKVLDRLVMAHGIDDLFLSRNPVLTDDVRALIEVPVVVDEIRQEMLGPFELPRFDE